MTTSILPCPFCPASSLRVDHCVGGVPGESYDRVTYLKCGASNPMEGWNQRSGGGVPLDLNSTFRLELRFGNAMHSVNILPSGKLDDGSAKRIAALHAVTPELRKLSPEGVRRLTEMVQPVCKLLGNDDPQSTACRLASAYINIRCAGCGKPIDHLDSESFCAECGNEEEE